MSKVSVVVTDRARKILEDASKNDWADADLMQWYNDATRIIYDKRPDARYLSDGTIFAYAENTATTAGLAEDRQLDDRWIPVEAHYVVFMAFAMDEGDTRDESRADAYETRFEDGLKTT